MIFDVKMDGHRKARLVDAEDKDICDENHFGEVAHGDY